MLRPDPRYAAAVKREQRQTDTVQALLLTHPALDPVERLHLLRTLASLDRRGR